MIIAMVAVFMVKAAGHQIIYVIAMRHFLVPASFVIATTGHGFAGSRVRRADGDGVLVVVPVVLMVQMAVVQVIHVPIVLDTGVPAFGRMLVLVFAVDVM